eukprot:8864694-Alexandrium_andersonii.AAC.1
MPALEGASDDQALAVVTLLEKDVTAKAKKKRKDEPAEPPVPQVEVPKTLLDESRELLPSILAQASAARNYAIALEPFGISTELCKGMRDHSEDLEKPWADLNKLCMDK